MRGSRSASIRAPLPIGACRAAPALRRISFEGSANAADIAVSYPAPVRIDEDGTEAFGYRDSVIFPLHVIPKDATLPVLLAVHLSYAVCAKICLPVKAEARLTLDPNQEASATSPEATALAAAEAEVPLRLTPRQRDAKVRSIGQNGAFPDLATLNTERSQDLFRGSPAGLVFRDTKIEPPGRVLDRCRRTTASKQPIGKQDTVPVT